MFLGGNKSIQAFKFCSKFEELACWIISWIIVTKPPKVRSFTIRICTEKKREKQVWFQVGGETFLDMYCMIYIYIYTVYIYIDTFHLHLPS